MVVFNRAVKQYLEEWKVGTRRKPLILQGARQVGKTTLVKQFALSYKHAILLNLEKASDASLFPGLQSGQNRFRISFVIKQYFD
jgi:predicted AAA+ superfamily ATPase